MKHYPFDEPSWINDLQGLMRIRSVGGDCGPVTPQAPLGQGVYDALDDVLELGKRLGFRVKMLDGRCAWVETGYGERMVAAIGHVDTVPVRVENWKSDPFDVSVRDGFLYGRGIVDNKGPVVLALHAMKALADSGEDLGKRIRLIVGGDNESGAWDSMRLYQSTEEMPDCAFSPDGQFPVVRTEKGMMHLTLLHPYDDKCFPLDIHAGYLHNSVPPYAYAVVDGVKYEAEGKAVHASDPESGLNALLELCAVLEDEGFDHPLVDLMMKLYYQPPQAWDELSGSLTITPAIVENTERGLELKCDVRLPVSISRERAMDVVTERAALCGFTAKLDYYIPPLCVPENSPLVKKLLHVYRDCTGRDDPVISSGVATYARTFDNAVTFGPLFPGEHNTSHTAEEHWALESMRTAYQIYCNAFREM